MTDLTNDILSPDLLKDLNQNVFVSLRDKLMPDFWHCVQAYPHINFVKVDFSQFGKDGSRFEAAVREYVQDRDRINAVRHVKGLNLDLEIRQKMLAWEERLAYFVLSEEEEAAFEAWNTPKFSVFCLDNDVHYVKKRDDVFYDLMMNKLFRIAYEELYPGSADDAATYSKYYMEWLL